MKSTRRIISFSLISVLAVLTVQSCASAQPDSGISAPTEVRDQPVASDTPSRQERARIAQEEMSQTSVRDFSRYDKAGPYDVKLLAPNAAAMRAEIRDFLWQHWSDRKLGCVVATFYSIEGEPSTGSYCVEPDEKGVWHIAVSVKRTFIDRVPSSNQAATKKVNTDMLEYKADMLEYKAYYIDRVRVSANGIEKYGVLAESEVCPPELYRLRLIDENKKIRKEI